MAAPVILASSPVAVSPITPALLIAAKADPAGAAKYGPYLAASATRRGITSVNAAIALLSNVLNESGGLTAISEDLFYRDPAWLASVFSSHFPGGAAQAKPYTCNPRALGNRVYASIGQATGGYDARGLGLPQLTGDAVHAAYGRDVGKTLTEVRQYLLMPEGAADAACWYFVSHGCGSLAEAGNLLGVRQKWAGRDVPNPMGWATVQKWASQVRAAMGGELVKSASQSVKSTPDVAHPVARQVTAPIVAVDEGMAFPGS